MSDFTFNCPACRQPILCDTAHAGMQVQCPSCKANLTVPQSIPASPPGLSSAGSQARGYAPPPAAGQMMPGTSGLAIASLVCSICTIVTCIGWLPGIICGHIALAGMRRNPQLRGKGMAMAGLVIGYLFLVSGILLFTALVTSKTFITEFKRGYNEARQRRLNGGGYSSSSRKPYVDNGPMLPADPLWTLELDNAKIPKQPAAGKIRGEDFTVESASLQNGILTLRSGKGSASSETLMLFLFLKPDEMVDETSFPITGESTPRPLHVHVSWKEDGMNKYQVFSKGNALKLEFGASDNGKIPTKIYLCLPDNAKSYVAGTFETDLPKKK
jgi:hypothetical protein